MQGQNILTLRGILILSLVLNAAPQWRQEILHHMVSCIQRVWMKATWLSQTCPVFYCQITLCFFIEINTDDQNLVSVYDPYVCIKGQFQRYGCEYINFQGMYVLPVYSTIFLYIIYIQTSNTEPKHQTVYTRFLF